MSDWYKTAQQVSEEEQQRNAERLRRERNQELRDSDYRMLPDYPNSDSEQWKAYRQQLRDITKQKAFPNSVQWPRAPSKEEKSV